jgi:hypothetical protein
VKIRSIELDRTGASGRGIDVFGSAHVESQLGCDTGVLPH